MLGLTPAEQGHLFHAALLGMVLISGLAPVWWKRQYYLRGLVKRVRCNL